MKLKLALVVIAVVLTANVFSQDYNPGTYMEAINNAQVEMNQKYMAYLSIAAHSRRAKKIEKMRVQAVESIYEARSKVMDLPYYKGDKNLRQANMDYLQVLYYVFNDDYAKIVNMEDLAEQSYDEMELYILLKEKTDEKLKEAYKKMSDSTRAFAARNNVNLIESSSEFGDKMQLAGKLNHYNNDIFLVFFKCNWQDGVLTKAINEKKINDVEQARNALIKYANEGLTALKADSLKSFDGDPNLAFECAQVLNFYKNMAQNDVPKLTDMFLKSESFEKVKKAFDAKPENKRTQADVDAYNKAVNDMNAAINVSNQTNNALNKQRTDALNTWDKADNKFSDAHMPHYKR
ncbi:MAG: hypothetical protein QM802_00320 [Agriterribacter sp.]